MLLLLTNSSTVEASFFLTFMIANLSLKSSQFRIYTIEVWFYYRNFYRLKLGQLLNKFAKISRPTDFKKRPNFFWPRKGQTWQLWSVMRNVKVAWWRIYNVQRGEIIFPTCIVPAGLATNWGFRSNLIASLQNKTSWVTFYLSLSLSLSLSPLCLSSLCLSPLSLFPPFSPPPSSFSSPCVAS